MLRDQRLNGDLAPVSTDLARVAAVSRFNLAESEIGAGCREIEIEGELDLAVSDRLQRAIAGCRGRGDQVLISLESCQFIDSTAIAVLIHAHREAGARVLVHSASDQVLRVLEITGLTADGLVFADREEALAALVQTVGS